MPRTRSLAFAELKLGIIAVVALVLAGVLIFAVGGGNFFWQQYPLKTTFDNVAGIKTGSPVRVAGVEVGAVDSVHFAGTGVEVWFRVNESIRPMVTTDSVATIGSISLLGEGAIDVTASSEGVPLQDWQFVPSGRAPGSIAELTESASAGLNEAKLLIQDLRAGKGTVGRLFTDDSVYREIEGFVRAAERVSRALAEGEGSLGRMIRDPNLYKELDASLNNLNAITASIRNGEGSLGQLVNDPAFAKSLTATTQNLEEVTSRMAKGGGTMGRLINEDTLYQRLDALTKGLDSVVQNLNAGQVTAGQLLQDKQLYENMNQAATELRGLIGDIRKDPKKYLNVRVSIF
jgi:phospholipid/cholesterol/gamma-HCH transport system substrate-binding protein